MTTIGERLKLARGKLSQADVARLAKVKPGTIGNIESGIRRQPRELLAIAKAVNVNPDWLLTGSGEMRPRPTPVSAAAPGPELPLAACEPAPPFAAVTPSHAAVLDQFARLLSEVPLPMRAAFGDVLKGWALVGGADDRRDALLAMLRHPQKQQEAA